MKRQKIQILVMLAILLVLGAALLGIRRYGRYRAEQIFGKNPDAVLVVEATKDEMTALSYTYEGEKNSFELLDGTWYIVGDHSRKLAQYRIEGMTRYLSLLEAKKVIENVTDLEQYGLADPWTVIEVSTDSASYTVCVGDRNEMTGDYYVCYPSGNVVYTVTSDLAVRFKRPLEKLLEDGTEGNDGENEEQ